MELLLLIGLLATIALIAGASAYWLNQRRAGTIVAVTIPLRSLPQVSRTADKTTAAHS